MARSTTRLDNLAIGCQYEDREHGLIAYIDCTPMQPKEVIRYRLIAMPAEFVDHGEYYSYKVDVHSLPLYKNMVLIDGIRPSVKRNAIATAQLRQEFSEWLEAL